jgi:hypothetical protein
MVLGAPSDASDVNYCLSQPRWRHVAHPQNNSLGTFFRTMETLNFFTLLFTLVSNIWASRGDENEVEATTSSNEVVLFSIFVHWCRHNARKSVLPNLSNLSRQESHVFILLLLLIGLEVERE